LEGALELVVAEAKRSGLYDLLEEAAIQRLKDSGSYESLITQVLEKEAAQGRPRDRAWAENWLENQFDYDRVGQNYVADAPYFKPARPYSADVWRSPFNRGNAEQRNKPKMVVEYYDAKYRKYVDMDVKIHQKMNVFNSLFNPVFNGGHITQPTDVIRRAIS
jgi:hypothetical protein